MKIVYKEFAFIDKNIDYLQIHHKSFKDSRKHYNTQSSFNTFRLKHLIKNIIHKFLFVKLVFFHFWKFWVKGKLQIVLKWNTINIPEKVFTFWKMCNNIFFKNTSQRQIRRIWNRVCSTRERFTPLMVWKFHWNVLELSHYP